MGNADRWFRWSFNLFIFLLCMQMGIVIALKSMFYQAEKRLKDNSAQVAFTCSDFNDEGSYWKLPESESLYLKPCLDEYCPDSFWKNQNNQDEDLHVLSVKATQPTQRKDGKVEYGHFVDIKLKPSEKSYTLALVSQSMLTWNLDVSEKSPLKEVLVIGPEVVMVNGLPENVKLSYFSKEKICSYPVGWEEIKNPENDFRRLFAALKEYTGFEVSSFQGKEVGRELRVPFQSAILEKNPMVISENRQPSSDQKPSKLSLGLKWQRKDNQIEAKSFQFLKAGEKIEVEVPATTREAYYESASQKVFIINRHQFGLWKSDKKEFTPLHMPLNLPSMNWPLSMTFNPLKSEIYIYNDDRGGEILSYNVVTEKWRLLAKKVGYSLISLHYDSHTEALYGLRFDNQRISEFVKIDHGGEATIKNVFEKPFDFAKNKWHARLTTDQNHFWLKISHPAQPDGELHFLSLAE